MNKDGPTPQYYGLSLKCRDYHTGLHGELSGLSYVNSVYITPPLHTDMDFCGFSCLSKWVLREKVDEKVE